VTLCPGVTPCKAPLASAAAVQGRFQCQDKEMQTEPDESIKYLKAEINNLQRHLGQAKVYALKYALKYLLAHASIGDWKGKDGRNVAAATNTTEWTRARVCSFLHSSFVDLLRELLASATWFVQQAERTQTRKLWQGFVHFFIHPLWICYASFWPATSVRHQVFNHE